MDHAFALISYYLHIPFPEELSLEALSRKWAQAKFLHEKVSNGGIK